MCTITWSCAPTGFDVVFSRDEQHSRALALPPRLVPGFDAPVLAPFDPAGGGTWIMVNAHGLAVCVLNQYDAAVSTNVPTLEKPEVSRGHLPLALARFSAVTDCASPLRIALASAAFKPCFIYAFDAAGRNAAWRSDGQTLEARRIPQFGMASTSSVDTARIVAQREERFRAFAAMFDDGLDGRALRHFHEAAESPSDAISVRMSRADARTVSLTRLSVRRESITMEYAPRERDGGFAPPTRHLLPPAKERATP